MRIIQIIALLVAITGSNSAQLSGFANLGFDLGIINPNNPNDPSTALPYWTVGGTVVPEYGGIEVKYFSYDSPALDAWAVSIHDGKGIYSFAPIDRRYSVFL